MTDLDVEAPVKKRKKPAGLSPTQLSLKWLRDSGWTAEVVERWNPHARIRQDLFGFIDIIAIRRYETLAVQCTSVDGVSARLKKIRESPYLPLVRDACWSIVVHGWEKKNNRWVLARDEDLTSP